MLETWHPAGCAVCKLTIKYLFVTGLIQAAKSNTYAYTSY